ncbi:MAG: GNAT family N-acetyltransferase [Nanoarchaeota archaeon]|nr:GNAT family N-acetyltransferase [Nanoarchaeota archaeon]
MNIRKANKQDWNNIAELIAKAFSKPPYKEKLKIDNVIKKLDYCGKIGEIFISEIEGKIIGVIIIKLEYLNSGLCCFIEELVIDEKYQRKGIGQALLETIEILAKEKKIKFIYLTALKKAKAFEFYKKIGYKEDKETRVMSKILR